MEPEPEPHSSIIPLIFVLGGDFNVGLGIAGILFLMCCSALVSGSEVAFFSLNVNDIKALKQSESRNSKRILELKKVPNKLLATILIANNFINVAIILLIALVLGQLLPSAVYVQWSETLQRITGLDIAPIVFSGIINTGLITFLLVLFGEILPKIYSNRNHMKVVSMTAIPLSFLQVIFAPISKVLMASTSFIENRLPENERSKSDLDKAIELTMGGDKKTQDEVDILKGILKFQDVSVTQIMKSRMDMVAVDREMPFLEVMELFKSSGYSRFPVFSEELDNIIGILYVKDFIGLVDESDDYDWTRFIRDKVHYVPESKNIYDLLRDFQAKKLHMAIVVDEFGGSSGLVTLEDVMEEVIGEIQDEFDLETDIPYTRIDNYNYLFEGKALINDVCRILDMPTDAFDEIKGESDSLAGLVLEVCGYIPRKNQIIKSDPYKFKIIAANHRRIEEIQITLPKETELNA